MNINAKITVDREAFKNLNNDRFVIELDSNQLVAGEGEITVPLKKITDNKPMNLSSQYSDAKKMVAEFESKTNSEQKVEASNDELDEEDGTLMDRLTSVTSMLMQEIREGRNPEVRGDVEKVVMNRLKVPFVRNLYLKKVESSGEKLTFTDGFSDFSFDIGSHNEALDKLNKKDDEQE